MQQRRGSGFATRPDPRHLEEQRERDSARKYQLLWLKDLRDEGRVLPYPPNPYTGAADHFFPPGMRQIDRALMRAALTSMLDPRESTNGIPNAEIIDEARRVYVLCYGK